MIFQVENGSFGFGEKPLFSQINFEVKQGEILSILGANGVGKTTLLRCMMGLLDWKEGCSKVDKVKITKNCDDSIWTKIGYVPQAKNTVSPLRAKDLVLLGRSAHLKVFSQPTKKDKQRALEALEKINMGHLSDKYCNKMSGGELQMVLIARALCIKPKMLILDEPESNLDFKNQLMVLDTISTLSKEEGISSIVNTHYPDHAIHLSNKSLLLNNNGKSVYGYTNKVLTESNLKDIFKVDVKIINHEIENRRYVSIVPLYSKNIM